MRQGFTVDQLSVKTNYEFSGFRLDTVLQVLVSPAGKVIALPGRAYDVLYHLVERAGELVDKASLMRAVWPSTVVEENNLNQCILTLRRAFGESAGERRFILTVPGRGFKFVAPVRAIPASGDPSPAPGPPLELQRQSPSTSSPASPPAPPDVPGSRLSRRRALLAGATPLAIALLALLAVVERSGPVARTTRYEALTDLNESATAPALSPDGKMLAFIVGGAGFLDPGRLYVQALPHGEPEPLTKVVGSIYGPAFSFDGTQIGFTYFTNSQPDPAWNTLTVPTTGGRPTLLLANAAGLTWIGPHQLLYSETDTGAHMGIVTSNDDRAALRKIYFPRHERGMAHYSWLSPDRRSVLIVEMDRTGDWQRCRLAPFDGSSPGVEVGPRGPCTSAAWSPDGRWMYFSATVAGHSHLWRQRYPRGMPEQITFGPTEEVGVAAAPDGRSLVTSLGLQRQSIWIHDASGERPVTSNGIASAPWLSADAKRLYFLVASASDAPASLWRRDLQHGQEEPMLPGLGIVSYDISPDEREAVFSVNQGGEMQIWIAPLDHQLPPRLLLRGADQPAFGGHGWIFCRLLGNKMSYLYRIRDDGSARQRVFEFPILHLQSVSPTGRWAAVLAVIDGQVSTAILGVGKDAFRWVRAGYWASRWSPDRRSLYVEEPGGTLPIALTGSAPPPIPVPSAATGSEVLPHRTAGFAPGPSPDTYAFTRTEWLRNIYRTPLPP
ncbi:MAG TPA: winged helix-turn-helix domain-containing protein [Steroidobacteraceae bacterium]|nr:winged helix-turn-helix domain-containing protein [Steroidobacteraceae bacterium]